jgi:carbamoylphosphate synthase small subunit
LLLLFFAPPGNYGVPCDEVDEFGIPRHFESDRVQVSALIVSEYSFDYSHYQATRSLSQWLQVCVTLF